MRVLLILVPFLVSPLSAIAADHPSTPRCESRLEAPAMALARIVEMAIERKLIDPVRIQQAFFDGRFTNPFAPASQAQYRRAFAAWEGQLSDTQKQIFRDRIARLLAKSDEEAKRSDRAKTETAKIYNPKVIDETGVKGIGGNAMTWLDGRPIFFVYTQDSDIPQLMIFDPFASNREARIRYLPPMNFKGSAVNPAHFHWRGHDYIILSNEKKVFDLRTLADVSEKFAAERLVLKINSFAETIVVNRGEGPYSISFMYNSDWYDKSSYALLGISLTHPEKPGEQLFKEDISGGSIKWLKKINLNGRELVAVQLERKIIVWDPKSNHRYPDIASLAGQEGTAKFFILNGRMACAHEDHDPQGFYRVRIVDVENGSELKLIPGLTVGHFEVLESRGKQWLVVDERHGYTAVNLEDDRRHEIRGVNTFRPSGVFKWEGEDYILSSQMRPPVLSAANLFDDQALLHPLEKSVTQLFPFIYKNDAYAFVEFKDDKTALIMKLFNPP